jgi:hypothetical protein
MHRYSIQPMTIVIGVVLAMSPSAAGRMPKLPSQIPDRFGWGVYAHGICPDPCTLLADDWVAADEQPIAGITFWGRWHYASIPAVEAQVSIRADDPGGPEPLPGPVLWTRYFATDQLSVYICSMNERLNWYDAETGYWAYEQYHEMWRYDIRWDEDLFHPVPGQRYWLEVQFVQPPIISVWGWVSSDEHHGAAAAYRLNGDGPWASIPEPPDMTGPLDLAFQLLPPCPGDVDHDGDTDLADLGAVLASFELDPADPYYDNRADLNGDGDTDLADLGILLADWNCTP